GHGASVVSEGYRRGGAVGRCWPVEAARVAAPWPATRYKDMVGPSGVYGQRFGPQCSYLKALPTSARHAERLPAEDHDRHMTRQSTSFNRLSVQCLATVAKRRMSFDVYGYSRTSRVPAAACTNGANISVRPHRPWSSQSRTCGVEQLSITVDEDFDYAASV